MITGHKYRIYPDEFQAEVLKLWIGHQRFIYNAKVQEQNYWYIFYKKSLSLAGQSYSPDQSYSQFRNPDLTPWLDLVPPEILRNGCYRYMSGYQRFRKGLSEVPVNKAKYGKQSVLITSELFTFYPSNSKDNKNHLIHIGNSKFLIGNLNFVVNKDNQSKHKVKLKDKTINKKTEIKPNLITEEKVLNINPNIKFKKKSKYNQVAKSNDYKYDYNIPKSITISLTPSGQWFISFNAEEVIRKSKNKNLSNKIENIIRTEEELMYEFNIKKNIEDLTLGLDRGINLPVAASNGNTYKLDDINAKRIAKKEKYIKRQARKLSRQKQHNKFSNNQNKTKKKMGKARDYINHTRNDFCHKLSHEIVHDEKNQVFVFENLKLANMVKKPKPKLDTNSTNNNLNYQCSKPKYLPNKASAKAGLNRELHAAELGRIKNYIGYKAARINKLSLFVNPAYSSQECSVCHHVDVKNRLSQSVFQCIKCKHTENADMNASKVIKHRGLEILKKFDISTYKTKSKKTVGFRKNKQDNVQNKEIKINSKSDIKFVGIGMGLPDFKPVENLSDIINSNDLIVLDSVKRETPTTSQGL